MKVKTKKLMSVICLILILLTSLPLQTFAAFITDINSNAKFGVVSGSLADYKHELHYANYDGGTYMLFCTQYGKTSPTGRAYEYGSEFLAEFKANRPQYEKMAEMIYFGYAMKHGMGLPSGNEAKIAAACTQQYVWETLGNAPGRDSWNSDYMSSGKYSNWLSQTQTYYNQYHSNVSFNGGTEHIVIGDTTTLTDSKGVLQYYKTFSETIDGVTFSHSQGSNQLKISVASNAPANNVKFNSNKYGLYQLLPNGNEYNSSTMSNYVYFEFTSGSVQNLMFSNYIDPSWFNVSVEVEYGNVLIVKTNTVGDVVGGCTFELYKDSACTQKVGTGTTNSNGELKFERLATGTFYCKEVSVPNGYLLDTTVKKVVVKNKETAEVTFKNLEPTGEISLIKTDKDTGNSNRIDGTSHHGDANLKGTEYTLYAKEDIYNIARTVKYFSKNEEIAKFTFNEYGVATVIVTNKNKPAKLSVDGNTIKGLPMGTYFAKETHVVEGYMQDTQEHTYTLNYKDMNTPVIKTNDTLKNTVQKAKFEVIKISSNKNTTADVIGNAEFTAILTKYVDYYGSFDEALKHLNEFAEDEYSVFKTQANGHGVSGLLAYGEYTVHETYTPSDEIETVEPFYIKIDRNSDGVIKEFIENDLPFESYLKMIKIDKNTGKKVTFSNATFKLYRLNDNNEWEKVKCKTGLFNTDQWKTDKTGLAVTEDKLPAGTYKIEEIKLPTGFLQLENELTFKINRSNKTLEFDEEYDAYITITVGNEQPTGTLKLDKSVAIRQDVDTSLVDISDLSKIKFKLTAKEKIIDYADGSTIYEKGQEVGKYNLTKEGKLEINKLPMGKYELEEIETLDGLVLDNTKHEIVFKQEDTKTKVYTKEEKFVNDTTVVEFSKTDITGDKELVGATLTVTDSKGNVIDKWVSEEKTHKIEGLKTGEKYTLKEEIQVDSYVKATDIEFTVENTKEIQKVTMIDKVVDMSKVDIGGNKIEGAEMQVLDHEGNIVDEWVSGKETHKIKNLEEGKTYILHEEVSVGYFVKATDVEFEVTYDKQTQHLEMVDKIVDVTKTDMVNGEEVEGAELVVTDEEGNEIDKWTSTKEPHHVVGLEEGKTYTLTETTCPYGYEVAESITFTVTTDKETQLIEMKDMPILKSVQVEKVDKDTGEHIKSNKFTFGIFEDEGCTKLIKEVGANEFEGTALFEDLRYGTFYIKELKAPLGYKLSDQVVKIEINDKGVFADGISLEETEGIYSFVYYNSLLPAIQTGNETNYGLLLLVAAIAGVGIVGGTILLKRKKNN